MAMVAAVTDEFSPGDLDRALDAMGALGMTGVELRVVWDRNIIDLDADEVDRVRAAAERRGMRVLSIASPVLKCVLEDGPALDPRIQQDSFASRHTAADQDRLAARAFDI